MSFSSRRRNYLLTPHRRDGLIEWMKSMLMHSFVLNALDVTGADTFSHFEMLIEEHRERTTKQIEGGIGGDGGTNNSSTQQQPNGKKPSRLKTLVPTVGTFHTPLPLRKAFLAYNAKYALTTRRHVCISFNEIRHILNLAQIMALSGHHNERKRLSLGGGEEDISSNNSDDDDDDDERVKQWEAGRDSPSALLTFKKKGETPTKLSLGGMGKDDGGGTFKGPAMITFDGDQTLYSDGANFESNPKLATYLYLLLQHGVTVAVVTAAGYEYETAKYELRLSGLLAFFAEQKLRPEDCERFYLFGGECNYLLRLGDDYHLHPVKEVGPGGWMTATKHVPDAPTNWNECNVKRILDIAERCINQSVQDQKLRARVIRKRRAMGLIPKVDERIPREALDETVLRVQDELSNTPDVNMPYCAFNGGRDAWVDVGNKRVGVQILQCFIGIPIEKTLHIGDQFLNTGNDYAARDVCPCVWITSPEETTYILKSILRLAGVSHEIPLVFCASGSAHEGGMEETEEESSHEEGGQKKEKSTTTAAAVDFAEITRRTKCVQLMDVYTGEMMTTPAPAAATATTNARAHPPLQKEA